MKIISQLFFRLAVGGIGLTLSFALMLHFDTPPATVFAYLLFFFTLRFIATVTLTHERAIQFVVASICCIAASFWTLRSTRSLVWDHHDASPYSIAWCSALILLCLLAIPHYASKFASNSLKPFRSDGSAAR